jgi:hypothetical protein
MKQSLFALAALVLLITACKKDIKVIKATFDTSAFTEDSCSQASSLQSDSGVTTITITFTNNTPGDLHINWIDYAGAEQDWIDVLVGTSMDVSTYLTHPWIVRKDDNSCVTVLTPKAGASATETVTFIEE